MIYGNLNNLQRTAAISRTLHLASLPKPFTAMLPFFQAVDHYKTIRFLNYRNCIVIRFQAKDSFVFNDLKFLYHQVEYGPKSKNSPGLSNPIGAVGYPDFLQSDFGRNYVATNPVADHGLLVLFPRNHTETHDIFAQQKHLSTLFSNLTMTQAQKIAPNLQQLMGNLIHMFERDKFGAISFQHEPLVFPASKRSCDQSLVATHSPRTNFDLAKICSTSLHDLQTGNLTNYPSLPEWMNWDWDYDPPPKKRGNKLQHSNP